MEYGLYLYGDISDEKRIEIHRKEWIGTALCLEELDAEGLEIEGLSDSSVGDAPISIQKSTLTMRVRDVGQVDFSVLFTSDSTKYKVLYLEANEVAWAGYLTPDSYSEEYGAFPIITLTARDNLGYLDQLSFDYAGEFITIEALVKAAQEKISWAMTEIAWASEIAYSESGGLYIKDAVVATSKFKDETWWGALEIVLNSIGCQLRYVGGGKFIITAVSDLYDVGQELEEREITYFRGAGVKSIIPSWKEVSLTQDYGNIEGYKTKDVQTSDYVFVKRVMTQIEQGRYVGGDFYTFVFSGLLGYGKWQSIPNANGDHVLLSIPSKRIDRDRNGEILTWSKEKWEWQDKYLFVNSLDETPIGEGEPYIMYKFPMQSMQSSLAVNIAVDGLYANRTDSAGNDWIERLLSNSDKEFFTRIQISFVSGSVIYYFNRNGWSEIQADWEILQFSSTHKGFYHEDFGTEEQSNFTINIMSLPVSAGVVGELLINILPISLGQGDIGEFYLSSARITELSLIFPDTETTGKEVIGLLNENGNVSQQIELGIGEIPEFAGDYIDYNGGLYDQSIYHRALTQWRRSDSKGGVMPLGEIVGRGLAHLYTSFRSTNGERIGGTLIEGEVKFDSTLDFGRRWVVNDKKYVLTSANYNVVKGSAFVMLREILPYTHIESGEIIPLSTNTFGESVITTETVYRFLPSESGVAKITGTLKANSGATSSTITLILMMESGIPGIPGIELKTETITATFAIIPTVTQKDINWEVSLNANRYHSLQVRVDTSASSGSASYVNIGGEYEYEDAPVWTTNFIEE